MDLRQTAPSQARARRLASGQGLVEYALILSLVAVVIIIILAMYGESLANLYQYTIDTLPF